MYELQVYHPGEATARVTVKVARAADVVPLIMQLLAEHGACERVVAIAAGVRLFAVDFVGNKLP